MRKASCEFEAERHKATKEKYRKQKERAASLPSSSQTFVCPKCGRGCASRIGLYSHQRAYKNWPPTFPTILVCEEWTIIIINRKWNSVEVPFCLPVSTISTTKTRYGETCTMLPMTEKFLLVLIHLHLWKQAWGRGFRYSGLRKIPGNTNFIHMKALNEVETSSLCHFAYFYAIKQQI